MNRSDAIKLVAAACANWPSFQDREMAPTAELWYSQLKDLPAEVCEVALSKVIATATFFPTVGDIRKAATDMHYSLMPSPEEAWDQVCRMVSKVGWTGKPKWSHPAVGKAAEAMYGGWVSLCSNFKPENFTAERAHFMKIYATMSKRESELVLLPPAVRDMTRQLADQMRAKLTTLEEKKAKALQAPAEPAKDDDDDDNGFGTLAIQ